jgi:hypothetical protein
LIAGGAFQAVIAGGCRIGVGVGACSGRGVASASHVALVKGCTRLERPREASTALTEIVDGTRYVAFAGSSVHQRDVDALARRGIAAISRAGIVVVATRGARGRVEGLRIDGSVGGTPTAAC